MSNYRQQAIEDVAKESGFAVWVVEDAATGVLAYAIAQRELVLELEAKLEHACDQLNAAMIGQRERQEQFERMAALCDQAIEQRDGLSAQVARLTAPVSDEEQGFWSSTLGFPEERLNMFIAYRAARAKEGQ